MEQYPIFKDTPKNIFNQMHENVSNILFEEIWSKFGREIEETVSPEHKLYHLLEKLRDNITDFVLKQCFGNDNEETEKYKDKMMILSLNFSNK